MKMVISCSRRTDVPAFYYGWLQKVLEAKSVTLVNPYNEKEYTVDLDPENVHSIVLWGKDLRNVLEKPILLDKYNLYFQYTITGRGGSKWEPHAPNWMDSVKIVHGLAKKYGGDKINWRFDPIFVEGKDDAKDGGLKQIVEAFDAISKKIWQSGVKRCTISFMEMYDKVERRLGRLGFRVCELTDEQKIDTAHKIIDIAKSRGMSVHLCAQEIEPKVNGCDHNGCIDAGILTGLFGGKVTTAKDTGQRPLCKCTKSIDIGAYADQPCWFNCSYCYANKSEM